MAATRSSSALRMAVIDFAAKSTADSEFDALIGLAQKSEAPEEEGPDKTRLPES